MSVHAGAERNVCIIKVSAETPQSTTNPSQAAPHVQTSTLTLSHPKTPTTFSSAFVLQVYLGQWTIPDTCICSTSAQKTAHLRAKLFSSSRLACLAR